MKQRILELSERYRVALQNHVKQDAPANFAAALELGAQAASCGLATLELARIHERAVPTLEHAQSKGRMLRAADRFFDEAIAPLLKTHRATKEDRAGAQRVQEALKRRTVELANANILLQRGIMRRKSVEATLKTSGLHYSKLLKESLQLQEGLRQLTHQVLAAQEAERRSISLGLQDEIAQTLLGINVRLISIKREAWGVREGYKSEIESTKRLIGQSAQRVRRAARDFRKL